MSGARSPRWWHGFRDRHADEIRPPGRPARLISVIDPSNSSAARCRSRDASDASFDLWTALVARSEVWPDDCESVTAVDFIAAVLSLTVLRTASTSSRKERIADSIVIRRRSCSASEALCRSACSRSVMSSCVPTQNGRPAIGRLTTEIARPSGVSTIRLMVLAFRHGGKDVGLIFLGGHRQTAASLSALDHVDERTAGFHDVARQAVHLDVAIIADDKLARGIRT